MEPTVFYGDTTVILQLGYFALFGVIAWILYQMFRPLRAGADLDVKYIVLEDVLLGRVCKKKNIDIDKEMLKRDLVPQMRKSFRKQIKEEIYTEMFGREKEDKK